MKLLSLALAFVVLQVIPDDVAAQSCGNKANVTTEIQYDGNPEANQIVYTEWGAPDASRDRFVLKTTMDSNNEDLVNAKVDYEECFNKRSLYAFELTDLGRNGIQDPGFFKVTANGREVLMGSEFETDKFVAFFALDRQKCTGTLQRFSLDLTFDGFPDETTWSLVLTANGGQLASTLCDSSTSFPSGETAYTFSEFAENTLYADCCIPPGDYVFIINDSEGDGMAGQYNIFMEGKALPTTGNGVFQSTWQEAFTVVFNNDDEDEPSGFACFPETAVVNVQDKGSVAMRDLSIGDLVQTTTTTGHKGTTTTTYEPIYTFGHYAPHTRAEFLHIITSGDTALELSPDHMAKQQGDKYIRASLLTKGDRLINHEGHEVTIQSISTIQKKGMYAPFTPSGKIVVNGIMTSAYSDILAEENHSMVYGLFSFQWIAHSFEFPHRIACHYLGTCPHETYTDGGVSTWMAGPQAAAEWLLFRLQEDQPVVQTLLMGLFLMTMTLFAVLEAVLFQPTGVVVALCLAGGSFVMSSRTTRSSSNLCTKKKVD